MQLLLDNGPDADYNQEFDRQMQAVWREVKQNVTVFAIGMHDSTEE